MSRRFFPKKNCHFHGSVNDVGSILTSNLKIFLLMFWLLSATSSLATEVVGTVRNLTNGQAATGDEVLLLRLEKGMQQEARTETDRQGIFALRIVFPNAPHIVRVLHQGVNYDQVLNGQGTLEIGVYDTARKVPGLSESLGIVKIEADQKMLKVTEMYAVTNNSKPPITQSGPHDFDFSLPANALFQSLQVRGPGGIWVSAAPLQHGKNRYGIAFPLRPGDTLIKFAYLVANDATTFHLKLPYPLKAFGVAHSPSVSFRALNPSAFKSAGVTNGLQIEETLAQSLAGEVPAFEISHLGTAVTPVISTLTTGLPAAAERRRLTPVSQPSSAPIQSAKKWWPTLSGIAVLLVLVVFGVLLIKRKPLVVVGEQMVRNRESATEILKDDLFRLESERLRGSISAEHYDTTKRALSESIQRVLVDGNAARHRQKHG